MTTLTLSEMAAMYTTGADVTAELERRCIGRVWRDLITQQAAALVEQLGVRVEYVAGQPFSSKGSTISAADQMFNSIDAGYLPISTDFNSGDGLNGVEVNLLFRTAHDLSHYLCDLEHRDEGVRCNFKLDGETRAAHRQAVHLLELLGGNDVATRTVIVQIVFSEIVLQGAVYYQSGDFADQQTVLVSMDVINGWFTQNGLTAIEV